VSGPQGGHIVRARSRDLGAWTRRRKRPPYSNPSRILPIGFAHDTEACFVSLKKFSVACMEAESENHASCSCYKPYTLPDQAISRQSPKVAARQSFLFVFYDEVAVDNLLQKDWPEFPQL
jgi:hypothetical protein